MTTSTEVPSRRPGASSVAFCVATVLTSGAAVLIAAEPAARNGELLGAGLVALLAAAQLLWPKAPTRALIFSALIVTAYHGVGLPAIGGMWPLLVPYLRAAMAGGWAVAASLAAVQFIGAVLWRTLAEHESLLRVGIGELQALAVVGLAVALGDAWWQRRRWDDAVRERLENVATRARLDKEHAMYRQRLAVASDLHDVTAHGLVVIGLQLRNAEETVDDDPVACRSAIASALRAHDRALHQTTATVRLLRSQLPPDEAAPRWPGAGMGGFDQLVDTARMGGVTLDIDQPAELAMSPMTSVVVYRICQEAVTNTLRHAGATTASISVRARGGSQIEILYTDNGQWVGSGSYGWGVQGMEERAQSVGGHLEMSPSSTGSLLLRALLPTGTPSDREEAHHVD